MSDNFLNDLLEEQVKKEQEDTKKNLVFLDIETGSNEIEEWTKINTTNKIQEILNSKYEWRSNWGEKANLEHQEKFEASKADKISKIMLEGSEISALDVWLNRIVIIGFKFQDKLYQVSELQRSEKEMLEFLFKNLHGKRVVTANGKSFDLPCLQIKAAKYGLEMPYFQHLDIIDAYGKIWTFRKEICSLDKLSIALDIKPNKYQDVDASMIGNIFKSYTINNSEEVEQEIKKILAYNAEDIRQTEEIFWKLNIAGLV